jgi:uncharacterized protein (DUF1778 family)
MSASTAERQTTINLRAPTASRVLIDRAAQLLGKSRTDFMLDAASQKAQEVLLDRTMFALDSAGLKRFTELLDAPLKRSSSALKLLKRRAPWETK